MVNQIHRLITSSFGQLQFAVARMSKRDSTFGTCNMQSRLAYLLDSHFQKQRRTEPISTASRWARRLLLLSLQLLIKPFGHCICANGTLLFRIDKTSLGVSRIGVATPLDDCLYAKSNANTFVCARAYRVFLTSCVGKPYVSSPPSSIVTLLD